MREQQRHANSKIPLDTYTQALSRAKRQVQDRETLPRYHGVSLQTLRRFGLYGGERADVEGGLTTV